MRKEMKRNLKLILMIGLLTACGKGVEVKETESIKTTDVSSKVESESKEIENSDLEDSCNDVESETSDQINDENSNLEETEEIVYDEEKENEIVQPPASDSENEVFEEEPPITEPEEETIYNKDISNYSSILMGYINEYREQNGLNPLLFHQSVNEFAQLRAQELLTDFSHHSQYNVYALTGFTPSSENIAMAPNPEVAFETWKNSPGHNRAMLHKAAYYGDVGVIREEGKIYWVFVTTTNVSSEGMY